MSIASELEHVVANLANAKEAIQYKGVTPFSDGMDTLADEIIAIEQGPVVESSALDRPMVMSALDGSNGSGINSEIDRMIDNLALAKQAVELKGVVPRLDGFDTLADEILEIEQGVPVVSAHITIESDTPFTITPTSAFVPNGEGCEWSINAMTWNRLEQGVATASSSTLYLRGGSGNTNFHGGVSAKFIVTGMANGKISGNIATLLDWEMVANDTIPSVTGNAFRELFQDWTDLVSAHELILPFGFLGHSACFSMFNGCTSLVNAPALPAMEVWIHGYNSMFRNCTSLVKAPALPSVDVTLPFLGI